MNREEVRAKAREFGIKNVSSYTKAELEAEILRLDMEAQEAAAAELGALDPEMREAVEKFIAATETPEDDSDKFYVKPARREIRKAGGRMGLYRMHKRPGSAGVAGGHWLKVAQQQEEERVAFLAAQTGSTVKKVRRALRSAAAQNGDKA